jgi:hypothetical protein
MLEEIEKYLQDFSPLFQAYATIGFTAPAVKNFIERGEKLNPTILSQFPPSTSIPESILQSCFPWGVDVMGDNGQSVINSSSSYNFIITNDDGTFLYCSCAKVFLSFFENSSQMQRLKSRRMSIKSTDPLDLPSFEMHFPTARNTRNTFSFGPSTENSPRDLSSLYIPKCIVLISKAGFIDRSLTLLKELVKISSSPLLIPLECYITHIMLKIPFPTRGKLKVLYHLGPKTFDFSFPVKNRLPLLDVNIGRLFSLLDLKNVLIIFRQLATEQSIVFLSSNENNLTLCSYILMSLLFPLKWSLLYAPILPEKLIDYLYSPVPFVFGMHFKYRDSVYARCNGSVLIVDLDHNKIETNLQAVKISQQTRASIGDNLPQLPLHYGAKLKKNLKNALKKVPLAPKYQLINEKLDDSTNEKIRECFLQFFVSILQGYQKYLDFKWKEDTISNIFEHSRFLAEYREKNCKFLHLFMKTQMFANFCQSRVKQKNKEDLHEKMMFDELIQEKLNRSKLRYTKLQIKFINQEIPIKKEVEVEKIYACYRSKGQVQYYTYPDFDYEVLKEFGVPSKPSEPRKVKIMKPVVEIGMPEINCKTDENFVLTTWVQLWAATLWYQQDIEHNQRLRELLTSIEKISKSKHPISPARLYKHLFESCMEVNPALALPIFSILSRTPVIINSEIIKLLRKIISKLFISFSTSNSDQSWLFTHSDSISPTFPAKYTKRVFVEAKHSSKQEVAFLLQDKCENCEKELNADDIKTAWNLNEDGISCFCGAELKPNLRIKIQVEVLGQNKFITENVKFISPKTTKDVVDELLGEGENYLKLDVVGLRKNNNLVFWNVVWHFYKLGLPYEFIMPYESEVVQSQYININHVEVDIIATDDKQCQTECESCLEFLYTQEFEIF